MALKYKKSVLHITDEIQTLQKKPQAEPSYVATSFT